MDPQRGPLSATSSPGLPPLRARHFLLFAVVYLYAFPYFDRLRSAQEMPRLLLTQEIVDRGVFYLDRRLSEMGSRNDLSIGPDGRTYANKTPGPSFVAIPAYLVAKVFGLTSIRASTWAFRVGAITIPALLFLPVFYRLTGYFTADERARRAALVALALASPALPYSLLLCGHQLAAVCLAGAFYLCVRATRDALARPEPRVWGAGLLAGAAPLMDYQASLAAPVVGLYLLAVSGRRVRDALLFASGAVPGIAAFCAYHFVCFGSPLRISYGYGVDTAPQQGAMGFIGPNAEAFRSTLFEPSNGLFVLMPWFAIAVVGAVVAARDRELRRRRGPELVASAALFLVYLVFLGSMLPYMARGGWSVGPRQMVGVLPFAGVFAALGFRAAARRFSTHVIALALLAASAVVFVSAATTYPHWPDGLANPLYELTFRLIWKGYAVSSVGTALGLSGLWALLPLYALIAAIFVHLCLQRLRRAVLVGGLALSLAAGLIAAHRLFPLTGPYSERVWAFVTSSWEPPRQP